MKVNWQELVNKAEEGMRQCEQDLSRARSHTASISEYINQLLQEFDQKTGNNAKGESK